MPAIAASSTPAAWFSARPGWLAVLVTGMLVPPLALVGCVLGIVLLLAGLVGRAAVLVGRHVAATTG